jgi:cell division septal protein FtsQ
MQATNLGKRTPKRTLAGKRAAQKSEAEAKRFESALPRFTLVPKLESAGKQSRRWWRWLRALPRPSLHWGWLLSLLLVALLAYGVYWTHSDERWFVYRERVEFENVGYLNADELYQLSEADSWNVLWLRSETIRQRLLKHPFVADAQVGIAYLPTRVTIRVLPAQPVALWVTGKGSFWLMANGYARSLEGEATPMLIQIIDPAQAARDAVTAGPLHIRPGVLTTALALAQRFPQVNAVRYNTEIGLNFALPGSSYYVYWGNERDFDAKIKNLDAGRILIANGNAIGTIIDVRRIERPFIR